MNDRYPRSTVLALALGALVCAAAPAAEAKAKGGRERIALARPATAPDGDAVGSVEVRSRSGSAVLKVRRLEPRSTYTVVDATTGAELGDFATNRRGRGRFAFGAGTGARRGKGGNAAVEMPDGIEIVDPETGKVILETDLPGDTEEPAHAFAFGFAEFLDDDGDACTVSLSSYPEYGSESFHLSLFRGATKPSDDPPPATNRELPFGGDLLEHGCLCEPWYEFSGDTTWGKGLPLGVATAAELAGRDFEIRDGDGALVIAGTLPELETFEDTWVCPLPEVVEGDGSTPDGGTFPGEERPNARTGGRKGKGAERPLTTERPGGDVPNGGLPDDGNVFPDIFPFPEPELSDLVLLLRGDDGEFVEVGNLTVWNPCDVWIMLPVEPWDGLFEEPWIDGGKGEEGGDPSNHLPIDWLRIVR